VVFAQFGGCVMDLPQIPMAEDVSLSEVCAVKNGRFFN
jgi:hypothetical protein